MFVVGVCAGPDKYQRILAPTVPLIEEPDTTVIVLRGQTSIATAYNTILSSAQGAEGVVLVHDDLEFLDPETLPKLRAAFADPDVAVAGVVGGRDVTSLLWWRGTHVGGAYEERDGTVTSEFNQQGLADTVDGIFLALSPWSIEHLRFDVRYGGFHAYDADICAQARAAGKRVVTLDIAVLHHVTSRRGGKWRRADYLWRARWVPMSRARRFLLRLRAAGLQWEYRLRSLEW